MSEGGVNERKGRGGGHFAELHRARLIQFSSMLTSQVGNTRVCSSLSLSLSNGGHFTGVEIL